jgi:hypothetical protein
MERREVIDAVREAMGINPQQGYNAKPSQFQIFKGSSAMRIQLDIPNRQEQEYKVGCLYLQAAPVKEGSDRNNRSYDWENGKVSVKIGVNDISEIIYKVKRREEVDLFHEFNNDTKSIKFNINQDRGYFLNIQQRGRSGEASVAIPLSPQEIDSLVLMLEYALPKIHNW